MKILNKNRNITINYINERFPLPFPNVFKIAKLVRNADVVHLTSFWTLLNAYVYIFCKLFKKHLSFQSMSEFALSVS